MKKIFNILTIGVVAVMSLTSCERDLTSLNDDPKHPSVLPSQNLLAIGLQQSSYYMFTGSVNFNNYRFFTQQWAQTTYTDETTYNLVTRNQPRNHFNRMYVYSINNYKTAKVNLENEANTPAIKANKLASLEISEIFVWENVVDTFGDVPYSEAFKPNEEVYSPKYDDAKQIYVSLLSRIDAAIATINESSEGYVDGGDIVYSGDMTKWKHFANSIKLRLAMNLADVDPALSKSAAESAVASGVISSEDESYVFKFDGGTFVNPNIDDLGARNDYVPSELVINTMNTNNDPRRATWFTQKDGAYVGGVFGELNTFADFSHMSSSFNAGNAPANLLSYVEVLFLKSEAAARGYSVGGTAATFYNDAILASMSENGVSTADAATYVAAHPYNVANWKQSIGVEAWVAMFNRGFAAWNFSRRLDYPVFVNPANSQLTGVPVRMPYSDQEYVLNGPNVKAAATKIGGDKATTKLFWDVN